jgi:hypothetical protein
MMKRFFTLMILMFCHTASSQYISNINPANTGDPRAVFANPAAMTHSAPVVVAGYQNLYSGLSSLSNSIVGLVYPTPRYGSFSITGQNFAAPMVSRTAFDLRYAWFFENLRTSLGLNLGSLATSYDRGEFQGVDVNDPLLAGDLSLSTFNMGFGVSSEIYKNLMLGFSLDHLNKPTVSLQGNYKKDTSLCTGLMYSIGNFRPMALWEYDENEHYFTFGSEYWFNQIDNPDINAMARGFLSAEHLSLGAGLRYKNIRLDYLFDYPMNDLSAFAGGTHQFVASYSLAQMAGCAAPQSICVVTKKVLQAHDKPIRQTSRSANVGLKTREFESDASTFSPMAVDSVCTFDLSHSTAACGWKNWLLGVYSINENGDEKVIWHASGKGKPAARIRWMWPRSLSTPADYNRTYYCKLRIVDNKGHVAISQPDQFYIEFNRTASP